MIAISLKEFYEKAARDPELGEKLAALSREYDEKLRALAGAAGFTLEEVEPLTDEEAQDVSAGAYDIFGLKAFMKRQGYTGPA